MSYSTQVFYYIQRQIVILRSGTSARIYMPQYAKTLSLHRGVDNQIQFQFLNQEQKPIDVTGKIITCRIINEEGNKVLLETSLNPLLPLNGLMTLDLGAADLENINPQRAFYSLEIPVGTFNYPVFVDANAGARGTINIVNSVLPSFVPSTNVTIPTGQPFPNITANNSISNPLTTANTYYSSVINTEDNPVLTIQTTMSEYNGNVTVQGSCDVDTNWYDITTTTYANSSITDGYVIKGYHPFVRLVFVSDTGNITNILAR
jgi:hypothetical protein